jgi:hypothetical protein
MILPDDATPKPDGIFGKDNPPIHRAIQHMGRIVSAPALGGLHHHYCRI